MIDHADTIRNPGATISEVLLLTEGYLNDGYGAADLRERLQRARAALAALLSEPDILREQLRQDEELMVAFDVTPVSAITDAMVEWKQRFFERRLAVRAALSDGPEQGATKP